MAVALCFILQITAYFTAASPTAAPTSQIPVLVEAFASDVSGIKGLSVNDTVSLAFDQPTDMGGFTEGEIISSDQVSSYNVFFIINRYYPW